MPRSIPSTAAYFLGYEHLLSGCVLRKAWKLRGRIVLRSFYFHSQNFETVLPALSTSYSNAPHALFSRASF